MTSETSPRKSIDMNAQNSSKAGSTEDPPKRESSSFFEGFRYALKANIVTTWLVEPANMAADSIKGKFLNPDSPEAHVWWKHFIAGGMAGMVSRSATAPLDRVKVLLQLQQPGQYRPIQDVLKEIIHDGGVRAFWRGNGVNVLKIAPETAMKFVFFDQIKQYFASRDEGRITVMHRFCSAAAAGALSQTFIYPLEVVKTRLTSAKTGQYRGLIHCAYRLQKANGLPIFYRGFGPNLMGIIPYAGIDLTVYETLKLYMIEHHPSNEAPNVVVLLTIGGVSSTCGQLASYPLALVRTRLQMQDQHRPMFVEMAEIVREGGLRALYRGFGPNFMKVAPAVSISYVVYEQVKSYLGISNLIV